MNMTEASFYTQEDAVINGKHLWVHLVSTPIGGIWVVQIEHALGIETYLYFDREPAYKKFRQLLNSATKAIV